ncbi:MAG: alpha-ketoacid dehydrogenase subunit beta [Chloroflexi bacterium]|nr:alpha-ketoacid dehydrogenase subunit beta [Chloroflexota bacterium]MCH7983112.1 alpha-ketoacid dehydrogenase subunit beta [Chloroflexota bacterium]MCH8114636.1 alpha-ketoacid dehydrogenase subunit beta [Chloroflexota bacterium]MCI0775930.1 alpha-ketoacid dehydrogenase subunit beta [Chloroflexota bacterium]MCI0804386.1 alpha-ketoacid dehydrogenase subunit beta [Chloroflexota bacterium]
MPEQTVIEAVRDTMRAEMRRDETVILLGEDIGNRGGVFLATDGFIEEFGADRVIDTPLAESLICGLALGAAVNGMRPLAEIQFADFVWPAINQIVGEAARVRYGTNGLKTAPLTIRVPYGGGVRGGLYHSQSVEVLFAHTPGLTVVAPATPYDAKGLLASAIRSDDPVIVLEHKRTYRLVKGEVPAGDYTVPIGRAEIKRPGSDMTIVTYGLMLHYALQAAEAASEQGFDVEVLDLRTLRPLDSDAIAESVSRTGKVLIVQEDTPAVSISSEVAAIIGERCFFDLDAPITRLTPPEIPPMPFSPLQEAAFMPSPEKILAAITKLAEL